MDTAICATPWRRIIFFLGVGRSFGLRTGHLEAVGLFDDRCALLSHLARSVLNSIAPQSAQDNEERIVASKTHSRNEEVKYKTSTNLEKNAKEELSLQK